MPSVSLASTIGLPLDWVGRVFRRVVTWMWVDRRMLIYYRDLRSHVSSAGSGNHHIRFVLNAMQGAGVAPYGALPSPLSSLLAHLRPDQLVHLLIDDMAVVGWGMSAAGMCRWPVSETRTEIVLGENECVLTSFGVLETHRRRGLYQRMLADLLSMHAEQRQAGAWIWCDEQNLPSRKAIERSGFRLVQIHAMRQVMGRRQIRVTNYAAERLTA